MNTSVSRRSFVTGAAAAAGAVAATPAFPIKRLHAEAQSARAASVLFSVAAKIPDYSLPAAHLGQQYPIFPQFSAALQLSDICTLSFPCSLS